MKCIYFPFLMICLFSFINVAHCTDPQILLKKRAGFLKTGQMPTTPEAKSLDAGTANLLLSRQNGVLKEPDNLDTTSSRSQRFSSRTTTSETDQSTSYRSEGPPLQPKRAPPKRQALHKASVLSQETSDEKQSTSKREKLLAQLAAVDKQEAKKAEQKLESLFARLKMNFDPSAATTILAHEQLLAAVQTSLENQDNQEVVRVAQTIQGQVRDYLHTLEKEMHGIGKFYSLLLPYCEPDEKLRICAEQFKQNFTVDSQETAKANTGLLEDLRQVLEGPGEKSSAQSIAYDIREFLSTKAPPTENYGEGKFYKDFLMFYIDLNASDNAYHRVAAAAYTYEDDQKSKAFNDMKLAFRNAYDQVKEKVSEKPILGLLKRDPKSYLNVLVPPVKADGGRTGSSADGALRIGALRSHLKSPTLDELQALFYHLFKEITYNMVKEAQSGQLTYCEVYKPFLEELEKRKDLANVLSVGDDATVEGSTFSLTGVMKLGVKDFETACDEITNELPGNLLLQPLLALLVVDFEKMQHRKSGINYSLFLTQLSDTEIRAIWHRLNLHQNRLMGAYAILCRDVHAQVSDRLTSDIEPKDGLDKLVLIEEMLKLPYTGTDLAFAVKETLQKKKLELTTLQVDPQLQQEHNVAKEKLKELETQMQQARKSDNRIAQGTLRASMRAARGNIRSIEMQIRESITLHQQDSQIVPEPRITEKSDSKPTNPIQRRARAPKTLSKQPVRTQPSSQAGSQALFAELLKKTLNRRKLT